MPASQIAYQNQIPSGHGWVTNKFGNPCNAQVTPWINNCNYDLAGEILKHFYGTLVQNRVSRNGLQSQLFPFDQSEFQTQNSGLFDYGYVYIPQACVSRRAPCRLHVALHGCVMNPESVQDKFVVNSGFNSWAESNNIIVLYPQVNKSSPMNPYGCWDWYGYTGRDYANRNGTQIIAIQKMVYRLLGSF
jgi:poly(3-hydroxybutyrate) depolymerase